MSHVLYIAIVGYLTAFSGGILACFSVLFLKKHGNRFLGSMMGFTAGLLIAFICFEMLPSALAEWNIYWGLGAMLLGVVFTAWLEGRMDSVSRLHKAGLLLLMGVCIHNFPEGMALGSMLHASSAAGMALAVMIAVHCYPETLAITLPLKQSGMKAYRIVLTAFLLALPMGLGALTGAAVSSFSPRFVDACVCFAGGVMLYIACGEILPESKQIWHGRMPAIGAMIGFAAGVWLTNTL